MFQRIRSMQYLGLLLCWFCLFEITNGQQTSRDKRDEKKENERVRDAERQLSEAKKKLSDAQSKVKSQWKVVTKARQATTESKKRLRAAEEGAEGELGKEYGVPEAMDRVKAARMELDKLAEPVISAIRLTEAWKLASQNAETARSDREAIFDNESLDEAQRNAALQENSRILAAPGVLEQEAVEANKECKRATELVKKEVEELDIQRAKVSRSKIQSHPKVVKAQKEVDVCNKEETQEEKELVTLEVNLQRAQKNVAEAQSKLQKAKFEDAKDANKGGRKQK